MLTTSVLHRQFGVSCCGESQWASAGLVVLMMENNAAPALIQLRVRHQCIKYWSAGKHNMEKEKMRVISQSEVRLFLPLRSKVIRKLSPFGLFPLKRVKNQVRRQSSPCCRVPGLYFFWSLAGTGTYPFFLSSSTDPFLSPIFFKS